MNESKVKKIALSVVGCLIVIIALSGVNMYVKYIKLPEYKSFIQEDSFEAGKTFVPLVDSEVNVEAMVLVAENDTLKLYFSEETTEIAVYDKRSSMIYYSNPTNRDSDTIANPQNKDLLASQVFVDFFDSNRKLSSLANYASSIKPKQYTIDGIEQGIRITYTIGDLQVETGIMPKFITAERLQEKVISKLEGDLAKEVKKQYVKSVNKEGFLEMRSKVIEAQVTFNKMTDAFTQAGYTPDDLKADNIASGMDDGNAVKPFFVIPLEYRLEGEELKVSIPASQIKENGGKISAIDVLRFFGAADNQASGYMLVPNGSGSLIYLNNGKTLSEDYVQPLYGLDPVLIEYTQTQVSKNARLPIYGMKNGDSAWFAMIENGDALTSINASVSGKVNSYNFVYPKVNIRDSELLTMFGTTGGESDLPVVEPDFYKGNIQVNYAFLANDEATYSGMATYYREKLVSQGQLAAGSNADTLEKSEKAPIFVDILGGVEKKEFFVGVPYKTTIAMTSINEASTMVDDMSALGIENINMRYLGWFNDGFFHDIPKRIDIINAVGNKAELKDLAEQLKAVDGTLYPDVAFQKVSMSSKSFMAIFESSRYISGVSIINAGFNRATMRMNSKFVEDVYYVISVAVLPKVIDLFLEKYAELDMNAIGLRDLGELLSSDKNKKRNVNREDAMHIVLGQLESIKAKVDTVLVQDANKYALPYATAIVDIPLTANEYYLIDETVPFYQMVIHGYIDYCGSTINFDSNFVESDTILKLLEYGSSPHVTFAQKEPFELKNTALEYMYSTEYTYWLDIVTRIYNETKDVLGSVRNQALIDHQQVQKGVFKSTYEEGMTVIVNYTDADVTVDGVIVEANDYTVIGGKN